MIDGRRPRDCRHLAGVAALVLALLGAAGPARAGAGDAPDISVKAAFLYNFAKFAEWPALPTAAPILVCIVGDAGIAAAFAETVRGQNIGGHTLATSQPLDSTGWLGCHVLFFADRETRQFASAKAGITSQPVLTVSDGKGFALAGGVIELFVEEGRMRFAINLDAAEQAGVHLSSRLLGLAKVVRSPRGH